jgi:hypothetical protein
MSCESKIEDFRPFWTGQLEKFKDLEERDSATHMVIKQRVDALNSLPKADKPLADEKDSAAAGSANKHDCNDDDWIDLEKSAEEINSEGECIGELKETEAVRFFGRFLFLFVFFCGLLAYSLTANPVDPYRKETSSTRKG